MKNSKTLMALSAGIGQAAAFGFWDAPSFSCPDNTNNQCTSQQASGFDFADLNAGSVTNYGGFNWNGFECEDSFSKRDLNARTSRFQSKCVAGKASVDKSSSSSFGCDASSGVDKTSISGFQVTPEFDCDLEFHYDMPDGSTCKHRSACSASGSTITNSQCGGATNVTVVYPSQSANAQASSCSFGIHSMSFDCSTASSTVPAPSPTASSKTSSIVVAVTTSSAFNSKSSASSNTPVQSASTPVGSSPVASVSTVSSVTSNVPVQSASTSVGTSPAASVSTMGSSSASVPAQSPSTFVGTSSNVAAVTTSSAYSVQSSASSNVPAQSSSVPAQSTSVFVGVPTTVTQLTSYTTTSTVYSTSVSTMTSCDSSKATNCNASPATPSVVTITVAVSTTICPVTETQTSVYVPTSPAQSTGKATTPVGTKSANNVASAPSSAASPVQTLAYPGILPSCLNTWLFSVGCTDNTASDCYCPDSSFTNNIYSCLAAHGETDDEIAQAISYFQGICGQHVAGNPGIATGAASITSYVTQTVSATAVSYTTIMVDVTTVLPCTNQNGTGNNMAGSCSTATTINTALTVPQVGFTTVSSAGSTSVGVIPVATYAPAPAASLTAPAGAAATTPAATGASAPYSTMQTSPVGTGAYSPSATKSGQAVVTAAAANVRSGLGFLGLAAMAAVAL